MRCGKKRSRSYELRMYMISSVTQACSSMKTARSRFQIKNVAHTSQQSSGSTTITHTLTFLLAGCHSHWAVPVLVCTHLNTVFALFKCRLQYWLTRTLDYPAAGIVPAPVTGRIDHRAKINRIRAATDLQPVTVFHATTVICRYRCCRHWSGNGCTC